MDRLLILIAIIIVAMMLVFAASAPPIQSDVSGLPTTPPDDPWFQSEVVNSPLLTVVEFGAKWCGPCRQLAPLLDKLESEYATQVKVVEIDVDLQTSLADYYDIRAIPVTLIMLDGEILEAIRGVPTYDGLVELVESHLNKLPAEVAP